ncbi:MAG: bifunctional 3-deoxy-7-phosphoheptulonate synthase/chorismate mutase type II [Bacteroidales bacterium]|nr:bifunctional 3-deoxy-7-phosphoheptulonate synthase/chorismate mutase type II [Bacteroidales bacterium]
MEAPAKQLQVQPIESWLPAVHKPLIISGPCSAESREQVLETAARLHATGMVSAFRSGVWKPRTRPGAFEGHGEKALEWLKEVNELYGFPLTVEVATPKHAEACLKAGIHILWIGARTSVNPFSIQELAESLKGVDIPVMVKNPLNPDLALWIGVIERFYMNGITKLAAIHRGFNTYERSRYRNEPLWNIPIDLKSNFPELPLICDPSHIAGKRSLLQEVAQQALLLDMNGLMIEAHCSPEKALTDAAQQLTPEDLSLMVNRLRIPTTAEENPCKELEILRKRIDEFDNQLINTLSKRMQIVNEIAHLKADCKMTILQVKRWNQIIETRMQEGIEKGLSEKFLKDFLDLIHKESIELQSKIIK